MNARDRIDAACDDLCYELNLILDRVHRNDPHLVVSPAALRKGWIVSDSANDYEVMIACDTFKQVSDWVEAFLRQTPGATLDSESIAQAWLLELHSVRVPDGLVREPSHVGGTTAGGGSPTRLRIVPEEAA